MTTQQQGQTGFGSPGGTATAHKGQFQLTNEQFTELRNKLKSPANNTQRDAILAVMYAGRCGWENTGPNGIAEFIGVEAKQSQQWLDAYQQGGIERLMNVTRS